MDSTTSVPSRCPSWIAAIALLALPLAGCAGDDGGGTPPDDDSPDTGVPTTADADPIDIGPTTTAVWADEFDRSCQADDDCAPVIEGDVCTCGCQLSAVNKEMYNGFRKARKRASENCDELPDCQENCEVPDVACSAGKCVVAEGN